MVDDYMSGVEAAIMKDLGAASYLQYINFVSLI